MIELILEIIGWLCIAVATLIGLQRFNNHIPKETNGQIRIGGECKKCQKSEG